MKFYKLGTHRNNRRVWLDNAGILNPIGFKVGARYNSEYDHIEKTIILRLHPDGLRKVAKKDETLPVIDLNSSKVGWALGECQEYAVEYLDSKIIIKAK